MDNTTESPERIGPVEIDERATIERLETANEAGRSGASSLREYNRVSWDRVKLALPQEP